MIEFDFTPTREQKEDRSFWESLPPEGALFNGYLHTPMFDVLIDGKVVEYVNEYGKISSMKAYPYGYALYQVEQLSKEHDNVSLKLGGWSESFIKQDRRQQLTEKRRTETA